jgi:hypothetical protein
VGGLAGEKEAERDASEAAGNVVEGKTATVRDRVAKGSVQLDPIPGTLPVKLPVHLEDAIKNAGLDPNATTGLATAGKIDPSLAAAALDYWKAGKKSPARPPDPQFLPFFPSPATPPVVDLTMPMPSDPFKLFAWPPSNLKAAPPPPKAPAHPKAAPKATPPPAPTSDLVSVDGSPVTQSELNALAGDVLLNEMSKTLDWLRANKASSKKADQVGRYYSALSAVYRQQKGEIELHRQFFGRPRSPDEVAADAMAVFAMKNELAERFPSITEPWEVPIQTLKVVDRSDAPDVERTGYTFVRSGIAGSGDDSGLGIASQRHLDNFTSLSVDPWTHDYVAWFPDGTQVAIPRDLIDAPGADGSYSINTPGGVREFMPKDSKEAPVGLPPKLDKASLPKLFQMIEKNRDTFDTAELLNLAGRNVLTHESMGESADTVNKVLMALMALKVGTSLGMSAYNRFGGGRFGGGGARAQAPQSHLLAEETEVPFGAGVKIHVHLEFDEKTGEWVAVGKEIATGKVAVVRLNGQTGKGSAFGSEGVAAEISDFHLVPRRPALPAGSDSSVAVSPSSPLERPVVTNIPPLLPPAVAPTSFVQPSGISAAPGLPRFGVGTPFLLPPAGTSGLVLPGGVNPLPWVGTPGPIVLPGTPIKGLLGPGSAAPQPTPGPSPPPGMTAKELREVAAMKLHRPNSKPLPEKAGAYDGTDGGTETLDYHVDDVKNGQPIITITKTITGADAISVKELDIPDVKHVVDNVRLAIEKAYQGPSPAKRGWTPVTGTTDVYFRTNVVNPKKITIIIQVPGTVTDEMIEAGKAAVTKDLKYLELPSIEVIVQPVQ